MRNIGLGKDFHIKITAETGKELRKVCGALQARDGFYTTYDNAIQELIRFWHEHKHIEEG